MKVGKLSDKEIQDRISTIPGWSSQNGKLHREVKFRDFRHAFGFMTQAALLCEKMDHHPEWRNEYNKLIIDLSTHKAGGITENDFAWASEAESMLAEEGLSYWSAEQEWQASAGSTS